MKKIQEMISMIRAQKEGKKAKAVNFLLDVYIYTHTHTHSHSNFHELMEYTYLYCMPSSHNATQIKYRKFK